MKKEFTHYGQKVLLAGNRSRYEMILEKNNVEYIPLPILSKTYRVVKYNNKYAVILTKEAEDDLESVIVTEALPDEAVQRLQTALADYAEDANGDGAVIVQINNYTWSADAALTDMNGQMAGATQMNTDLANGESKIWILDDPEGFEQAYGALSEKLGADWQAKLIPWSSQPALSGLELGSYNTAADGSQTVDIQSRFAGYSVAVFDASDALWQALNS